MKFRPFFGRNFLWRDAFMAERWDLFDEDRVSINRTMKRGNPMMKGTYHMVVQCWVMTSDGRVVIDKRNPARPSGGLFECSGGSVLAGESSLQGIMRELLEEIGLKVDENELVLRKTKKCENCFVDIYTVVKDIELCKLRPQEEEVIGIKLVTLEEYDKLVELNLFAEPCTNLRRVLEDTNDSKTDC